MVRKSGVVERTSSRIFFQMILVISSPSSSTTGFATAIFVPGIREEDQDGRVRKKVRENEN